RRRDRPEHVEPERRHGRDRGARPARKRDRASGAAHYKRDAAGDRFVVVPRPPHAADATADERGRAVAEREYRPRGGHDIEARRKNQNEEENRERIQDDAERKPAGVVNRPIEPPSADSR